MEHDNGKSGIDITGLLNAGIASNTINSDELLVELKKIKDKEITIDKYCYSRVLSASYASLDFNVAQNIVELLN